MLRGTFGSLMKSFSQQVKKHRFSFTTFVGPLTPEEVGSKGLPLTFIRGSSKTLSLRSYIFPTVKRLLEIDQEKAMVSTANDENIWSQVTDSM